MISSLFILNTHGDVIIELQFLKKLQRIMLESFWSAYFGPGRLLERLPSIMLFNNIIFLYIQHNDVVLLATCDRDGSALISLDILNLIAKVLNVYFKGFSEAKLRDNFSLVYQLLQELLDHGYPFLTEIFSLEELVPRPTLENKVVSILENAILNKVTNTAPTPRPRVWNTTQQRRLPWRSPVTKHSANEILFDVVEQLDYIMDSEGELIKASVRGSIEVNCRLNGLPDVQLRLINADSVDDAGFHRCVKHLKRRGDYTLSFVPPDGKFTLMQYACSPELTPRLPLLPFYVTPQISYHATGGRFNCMIGTRGGHANKKDPEREVQNLKIIFMFPFCGTSLTVTGCTMGSTSFDRSRNMLTWSLGTLMRRTASLQGEFILKSEEVSSFRDHSNFSKDRRSLSNKPEGGIPYPSSNIFVSFHISNYSVSGLHVESVQILNEVGKPYKGVKYVTEGGNFLIRAG